MRRVILLSCGWAVFGAGILLLPLPVPMPFPIAFVLMMFGTTILSAQSRRFRHGVQYARHRYVWLSKSFEAMGLRAPESVKKMVRRTHPGTIERYARLLAARDSLAGHGDSL